MAPQTSIVIAMYGSVGQETDATVDLDTLAQVEYPTFCGTRVMHAFVFVKRREYLEGLSPSTRILHNRVVRLNKNTQLCVNPWHKFSCKIHTCVNSNMTELLPPRKRCWPIIDC